MYIIISCSNLGISQQTKKLMLFLKLPWEHRNPLNFKNKVDLKRVGVGYVVVLPNPYLQSSTWVALNLAPTLYSIEPNTKHEKTTTRSPPPYLQFISKEESFQGIDSVLARHNEGNNPRLVKTSIKAKLNESDPRTNEHSQL